jgi:hypothetical protein
LGGIKKCVDLGVIKQIKTMETADFEVEFELENVRYRVDGIAYYYDQDYRRNIDYFYISSCMRYYEHLDIWITSQLTKDILDVVGDKLEVIKGSWQ